MRIAIASGKGGTGKTTVSTNLALAASRRGLDTAYIDCDVEEPNGQLFLKPQITASNDAVRTHPSVDEEKCVHCGRCGEICQFSAIVCIGQKVLVYPELCHGCGGCTLVCDSGAIREVFARTGTVETGTAGPIRFAQGTLRIGEAMSTPLIRQVKKTVGEAELTILDCPPGTSCPVIESVRGADLVLLVTEPTPFGLNDLRLAVDMVAALRLPMAVLINRSGIGDRKTYEFCQSGNLPVWAEIPDDRRVAETYSRGEFAYDTVVEFRRAIDRVLDQCCQRDWKESLRQREAMRR
ncbi:MAG: ATP-binding protein [Terracidiphilus sp.]